LSLFLVLFYLFFSQVGLWRKELRTNFIGINNDYLRLIANSDENLLKQKDEFIKNAKEIKVSKNIQGTNLMYEMANLNDVQEYIRSINNLIYPNKKHSSLTCPDCGKIPFWILGREIEDIKTGDWDKIRYYAICSKCNQMVSYYDESIYNSEVFKRIKKLTKNNENFKNLTDAEITDKIAQMDNIKRI